jgi:prefoldin subunit 5
MPKWYLTHYAVCENVSAELNWDMSLPEYLQQRANELRAIRQQQQHQTFAESARQIERVRQRVQRATQNSERSGSGR